MKRLLKKIYSEISMLPIKKYIGINGWLTKNEALLLYKTSKKLNRGSVTLEIGSWQGKSTYCIAKGITSGMLYAIDPFNGDAGADTSSENEYIEKSQNLDLLNIFKMNMKFFLETGCLTILKGYSYEFSNSFEKIDFLFIDGDHSIKGCINDYELYAGKISKGGFIAFHDYDESRPELGPTHVIQQIILKENNFVFYKRADSLWIARKL